MKTPQDYLISENSGKEYTIRLKDGSVVWAYVAHDLPQEPLEFFLSRGWDAESLKLSDIEEVIQELPDGFSNDCYNCFDGKVGVERALQGENVCFDCKEKEIRLEPFKTNQKNVYKYDNLDQLQKLFDTLGNPIADNFETDWNMGEINKKGLKDFGLMYCWSNMGDFDDYPLDYCAIIQGVKI